MANGNGAAAPMAKTASPVKRRDHGFVPGGRADGVPDAAGAGGFLGALVRSVQATCAGAGAGSRGRGRKGRVGQDEHRRASADRRPAWHPVDSGGDRVRQGPAGRRLRRRACRRARSAGSSSASSGRSAEGSRSCWRKPRTRRRRATRAGPRRSTPRSWRRTRATRKRSAALPSSRSRPDSSIRPRPCLRRSRSLRPARTRIRDCGGFGGAARGRAGRDRRRTCAARTGRRGQSRRPQVALRSRRRAVGQGRPRGAADQLLEIIRRDRKWNDEAARKQLLQLFEAWGLMDPATVAARRKLSAIWF